MSNYPDGMPGAQKCTADFKCEECGHEWEADGISDLGGWQPNDEDDLKCLNCGEWAE